MNTYKCVYIAIDLHSNHSMVGYMNDKGKYIDQRELRTTSRESHWRDCRDPGRAQAAGHRAVQHGLCDSSEASRLHRPAGGLRPAPQQIGYPKCEQNDGLDT